ncbi:hypothetical protein Q3G72_009854 [Acer saccharum]|nr:hypothetical protein Q3G72_009854 [Acer saccharum]
MAPPKFYQQNHFLPLLIICMLSLLTTFTALAENWLNHGGDLYNRRHASRETKISTKTVSKLSLKWEFFAGKDISATPSIFNGTLYFPSWNGQIYADNASDGSLVWKKNIRNLTGLSLKPGLVANVNWTVSGATPTIVVDDQDHDLLIIGVYGPAFVVAVKRSTGELVWSTQLDQNPAAVITMSGTYYKGPVTLAKGVFFAGSTQGKGRIYTMDAKTGKVIWSNKTGVNTKQAAQKWPNHVGDLCNRRYTNKEKKISPETETVSKLHLKWKFYARGDISVTPAIVNDTIYFPSWNGNLYAVTASDGITCLEEEHAEAHWL